MKNRRNRFLLAIVAFILVLGVGYAVVSSVQLTIEGTGTAATENLKVVFDGVNNSSGIKVTSLTAADDSRQASFSVTDMVLNTEEWAEFEIKNKETDVNATIVVPSASQITYTNSTYFDVKLYYNQTEWTTNQTLNATDTAKIRVGVRLKQTPVSSGNSTTNITVQFDAQPAS